MSIEVTDEALIVCLLRLEGMGPARLGALLEDRSVKSAWRLANSGAAFKLPGLATRWRGGFPDWAAQARAMDPLEVMAEHKSLKLLRRGTPDYPTRLLDDPEPPELLFTSGGEISTAPSVAVVGTRRCTRYGRDVARDLGMVLGSMGISVVSGLAQGIDAAVHRGALESAAQNLVGVVATGLDVVYPRCNADLWSEVSEAGVLLTETPLGSAPFRWRFPARNRIIAGLADVTVVVESHETGGSLYTAIEAQARSKPVFAVPGSIRSPASVGTNALLADGCIPMCSVDDVCTALETALPPVPPKSSPVFDEIQAKVIDAIGWEACSIDQIVLSAAVSPAAAAFALDALCDLDVVACSGGFYERLAERR